jgi:hypothetical protein
MSDEWFKAGIRFKLDTLSGKSIPEVEEFFRKMGIWSLNFREGDDSLTYIPKAGELHPRKENGNWYLEFIMILEHPYEYPEVFIDSLDVSSIREELIMKIARSGLYPFVSDPVIFSYTWNTGTDEPFGEPKKYWKDGMFDEI